ncbi:MAG: ribulose-phosphate 3-epimerase [Candidatus Symbiothrix sp.]|jgi:ribulose-phosphate 3-epimerase|nr:ribulose-phosphate 3-epimerase [Candidatus Symbiothrix sp.]
MDNRSFILSPSLLAADFLHLQRDVDMLNQSLTDWIHLDVMDGVFVPNISIGFPVMEQVAKQTVKPLDAHLMIVEPQKFITRFRDMGVQLLTVHYEACTHLHRTVMQIKEAGMKAGVALNPHTPVELLRDILPELDLVLIMSVNPGFSGQKFIPQAFDRVQRLRQLIDSQGLSTLIEVDGGIDLNNAPEMLKAGANALVAGNAIFKTENPLETIKAFKKF